MGRTAYDLERYAVRGIRRYLKMFEIPRPADSGHLDILLTLPRPDELDKSHENRKLTIANEPWRILEFIVPIRLGCSLVSAYLDASINNPIDTSNNINLADPLYALPSKLSDKFYSHKDCDIEEMKSWLALPLVTAMRVWHIASESARTFTYSKQDIKRDINEADARRFQTIIWASKSVGPEDELGFIKSDGGRLAIAYQTPYTLNAQDMRDFVGCVSFPSYQGPTRSLPSCYSLWAKIWDTCHNNLCRWFILTSYNEWVFGCFSDSMRTVFVSSVYSFNNESPTILELLVYWMGSAMGHEGTFIPPMTTEPVPMDTIPTNTLVLNARLGESTIINRMARAPRSVASNYAWPGQNDESFDDPNIDLQSVFNGEGSLITDSPARDNPHLSHPVLRKWIAGSRNAFYNKLDEDDFVSAYPQAFHIADDLFDPSIARGEWMM